jgi:hypothetical protein
MSTGDLINRVVGRLAPRPRLRCRHLLIVAVIHGILTDGNGQSVMDHDRRCVLLDRTVGREASYE